ncbi:MAG: sigma 54-interacting transcriptional regulator [Myxococcales bacterium]|nr:sigma 54-interacting transcriptional regulator [Myxococcales bacterium]
MTTETTLRTTPSTDPLVGPQATRNVLRIIFHRLYSRWAERVLLEDGTLEIGRDRSVFPRGPLEDSRISRRHARIVCDECCVLEDLGSTNGTFVNGTRIERRPLARGDVIRMGDTFFVFDVEAEDPLTGADCAVIGLSSVASAIRSEIVACAALDSTVLVVGEAGVGKDLIATELHRLSRRKGTFVAVNCGAIPESLMESELFGHQRGAFSGAVSNKQGLFAAAQDGTIFLDEIGETPLAMQVKLLRVLQNREVRPVGATESFRTNARVICATNRDMVDAVQSKTFRADLYSRITQWMFRVPPLRQRLSDIPSLMMSFLERSETRKISADLIAAFVSHSWPFNVRELRDLLQVCVHTSPETEILFTPRATRQLEENRRLTPSSAPRRETAEADEEAVAESDGELGPQALRRLLRENGGNVNRVAQRLGKHRNQLYRLMKRFQIDPADFRR